MKLLAEQLGQKSFCNYVEVLSCVFLFWSPPNSFAAILFSLTFFSYFGWEIKLFCSRKKKSCVGMWKYLIDMGQWKRVIWAPRCWGSNSKREKVPCVNCAHRNIKGMWQRAELGQSEARRKGAISCRKADSSLCWERLFKWIFKVSLEKELYPLGGAFL